jgi:hypothetical protein
MISLEELKSLYENQLKEILENIDISRKLLLKNILFAFLEFIPAIIIIFTLSIRNLVPNILFWVAFIIVIICIIIFIRNFIKQYREYREKYKKEVVSQIVSAIDSEWTYTFNESISLTDYVESNIFTMGVEKHQGDDLISGKIENTEFKCSKFQTEYINSGMKQTMYVTIFKGLFFYANFNKAIHGETYIAPYFTDKGFAKLGHDIMFRDQGELVKLENPEFEKIFVVHATDQIEARYILTYTLMESMVNLYKMCKRPIYFSFKGSKVFCAICFKKDLFEPSIFKSCVKFKEIAMIYNLFMLNAIIIKELNLNVRIWTKE